MTTAKISLNTTARTAGDKTSALKHTGYTPGNIFGLQKNSEAISVQTRELQQFIKNEGTNGLLYLRSGDTAKEQPVLIEEVQQHPVTGEINHISFKRVNLKQKIVQEVPVRLEGSFEVKDATVLLVRDALEIEALPTDLLEEFVIDISKLTEVGQEVRVSDLVYDKSIITVQVDEEDENPLLALVQEVKEVVEEEPVAEAAEGDGAATEPSDATVDAAEGDVPDAE